MCSLNSHAKTFHLPVLNMCSKHVFLDSHERSFHFACLLFLVLMEVEKAIWDNLFLEKLIHTGCAITELHFTNVNSHKI